jgi:aspartate/methionine/tyrosine aminotransferase
MTDKRYSLLELAERLPDVISLGRGDPDAHTAAPIVEAACARLGAEAAPAVPPASGLRELRLALAERYRRDKLLDVDPDCEVLITNGAQEGLFLALLALVDPGDGVLLADPRYSSYDQAIAAAGGRLIEIPTTLDRDFRLSAGDLAAHAASGKVLVFVNPNNPTSALVPAAEVRAIAVAARDAGLIVISDEIYESLTFDGETLLSVATCDGMRERTVTLSGFSKTYAMTGFRVGYLIGPPAFIAAATALKAALSGPTALLSQYAALAALDGPQDVVEAARLMFAARRAVMIDGLSAAGIRFGHPGGGFYLWADVASVGLDAETFCYRLLTEAGVLMFPGTAFGARWGSYVRISLLQPEARLVEAVARIARFVARVRRGDGPPADGARAS